MESDSGDKTAAVSVKNFNTDTAFCGDSCNQHSNPSGKCNFSCCLNCPDMCVDGDQVCESLPPSPLPTVPSDIGTPMVPNSDHPSQKDLITITMSIMGCMIGALLLFCILWKLFRDYRSRRRNSRRITRAQMSFGNQGDFFDEYQGPFIDHPIWYINTIGLEQSVIDSIAIFKYKKDEGLIDGTECSVCLNVFQDDESLRLLPKCGHAFHVSCIDTWLRSHQNCPLCRAPIASNNIDAQISSSVATTSDLSPTEEPQMENSVNYSGGNICNQAGEDETSQVRNGDSNICQLPIEFNETIAGNSRMNTTDPSILRNQPRVQCDLVGNIQAVEAEMQPIRSSVSLDFSSASASYDAVTYGFSVKHQEDLDTKLERLKHSKLKKVANRGSSGKLSFHKLIRSSSIGLSLQRGPQSMKRTFSYSGKSSSSRHSRSQDSILPL